MATAPLTWKEYWHDKSATRRCASVIGVTLAEGLLALDIP